MVAPGLPRLGNNLVVYSLYQELSHASCKTGGDQRASGTTPLYGYWEGRKIELVIAPRNNGGCVFPF